jgi:small subunit ribosomal protein S6
LRNYELVYILRPDLEDENRESVTAKIEELITASGGQVLQVDSWGLRRLAYSIQRFGEGYYVLAKINLRTEAILELRRGLGLTEEVIRYLLIRTDEEEGELAEPAPEEGVPEQVLPEDAEHLEDEELGG